MDPIRAALIACLTVAAGCHATRTLVVHPRLHANHDRRFYIVVRALREDEFVKDAYQRIADVVFPAAPDPSVKAVRLVAPGHDDKVQITLPDDQPFAVYALVSEPGDAWKVLLTPPFARRYDLVIDGARLSVGPAR